MVVDIKQEIIKLRQTEPEMPAIEIARRVCLSRERVRQILLKLKLPTKVYRQPGRNKVCGVCGRILGHHNFTGICRWCKISNGVTT